jgi:hypothetical protein
MQLPPKKQYMADQAPHDVYHYGLASHLSRLQLPRRLELIEIKKKAKLMNKLAIYALLCALSACSTQMQSKLWIPDWKETAPLSIPRAGAAAIAVDDTLYLIGGVDGKDSKGRIIGPLASRTEVKRAARIYRCSRA